MVTTYKFSNMFGPAGTTAGYLILTVGVAYAFFYPLAILLAILGAFVAFTHANTYIDSARKKVRFANMLFGIIPYGRWVDVTPNMHIGIKKSHRMYTTYSRSNRQLDIERVEFRIILYNEYNTPIVPLAKFSTQELAQAEMLTIASNLGIEGLN